jgi:lysozyme
MPNQRRTDVDPDGLAQFRAMMADAEGVRSRVYLDTRGNLTVGIGHRVTPADGLKLGQSVTPEQIDAYFLQDGGSALGRARDQARQAGISDPNFIPSLASVNFQLGHKWPGSFPKTWAALSSGDYSTAAMEAGRSNWMKQTPKRVRSFQDAILALRSRPASPEE